MKFSNILASVFVLSLLFTACMQAPKKDAKQNIDFNSELTAKEKAGGRLTAEILWKFGRVSDPQLSPDGTQVLYGVRRYNLDANKGNSSLFIIPVKGGEAKQLTDFQGSEFNARWTEDGKIVFISTRSGETQIWQMNADGSAMKQVSNIKDGIDAFELAPKGGKVFYTKNIKMEENIKDMYPNLKKANAMVFDKLMYRHWDNWTDNSYSHIFVSDFKNGKIAAGKDIMEGELWDSPLAPYFDSEEISWSPDGKLIAYTSKKMIGRDYATSTNSDVYLYNVDTGETKNLTKENKGYDKYPVFSPDSKQLAWQSMETDGYESDKHRLFVMDLATGKKEYINSDWDQNANHYVWSEDAKSIYFISGINATYQLYKVDLASKKFTQITKGHHNYQTFQKRGDLILGAKMSHAMATELFVVNEADGKERQLTFTNKNIYDNITMGKSEEHWVKTTDGKDMLVWVILPPNFDPNKKYPALLYCQGGPQSAVSQFFSYRWNFQMMAANDYIIFGVNRRGLPSFGHEWNKQISGDYSGQNIKDYLSAVDELKTLPYVDENRLGAVGASYGGYSVYYLAGHHEGRFKALISHCGMFNFESFYAATEETFFPNNDLGGAYWDKKNKVAQRSYANSPHKFVDKWDTPMLIIAGGYDFRIPYTESVQAFNICQLRGIPSKFLYFPEETHFVVQPQNSVVWQTEFHNFLDTYLK